MAEKLDNTRALNLEYLFRVTEEEVPRGWRNICPCAYSGCEDSKITRTLFEKDCANLGGNCHLLGEPKDYQGI